MNERERQKKNVEEAIVETLLLCHTNVTIKLHTVIGLSPQHTTRMQQPAAITGICVVST